MQTKAVYIWTLSTILTAEFPAPASMPELEQVLGSICHSASDDELNQRSH